MNPRRRRHRRIAKKQRACPAWPTFWRDNFDTCELVRRLETEFAEDIASYISQYPKAET